MHPIIKHNIQAIETTCKSMGVKHLYVFGSTARETDFDLSSDIDFLYAFIKDSDGFPKAGYDYFDLLNKLEEITGKKVDLVAEEKIKNSFFLNRINKEKIKVYES